MDAAPSVVDLLESSARLKVVVTSRLALRIYGEQEFPVLPLPLPPSAPFAVSRRPLGVRLCRAIRKARLRGSSRFSRDT